MAKRNIRNKRRDILLGLIGIALLIIGFLTSCGIDDDVELSEAQELAFEKLAGQWTLKNGEGSIKLDGADISINYPGFSISYDDGTYSTTNAGTLFRASGTWEWQDEEASLILIDDGKEVTLVDLTDTSFIFSFNYAEGSRRAGLPGDYVIQVLK